MIIIEKEIKKVNENVRERLEKYKFNYKRIDEDIYEFDYMKMTKTLYPEIENVFSEIKYNIKENKVINLDEVQNKWNEVYEKYLFATDEEMCELVVDLNRYYSLKENLEFLINNFAFFPFFKLIFGKEREYKEFKFYNVLDIDDIDFDITKKVDSEKDKKTIKISGKPNVKVDLIDIKKELRETLSITPDKILNLEIFLEGEGVIFEEKIEKFEIGIYLKTNGYIDKTYKIEIIEEKENE